MNLGDRTVNFRDSPVDGGQQSFPVLRECFVHLGDHFVQALQVVRLFALQARRAPVARSESTCDLVARLIHHQLSLPDQRASFALNLVCLQQVLLIQLFHIVARNCVELRLQDLEGALDQGTWVGVCFLLDHREIAMQAGEIKLHP